MIRITVSLVECHATFVEHRDGSASCTLNSDGSWLFERKLNSDEDEYQMRNSQVNQRVSECEKAFHLLKDLNDGQHDQEWTNFAPSEDFKQSVISNLDLENGCVISGHSFGSATTVKAMHSSK